VAPFGTHIRQQQANMPGPWSTGWTFSGHYSWLPCRISRRSPRIRTCLRAEALQRAGVNFPCTNAAFTLSLEPVGFVVLCQLARRLSLICGFCSSSRTFAIGLPSDPSSRRRPCLRLVLLVVSISLNTIGSRTGDFLPRRSLWRRQVTP
jgi:hypothetical protein